MPTWKYLLKTLYSNQTIIDGRKRPWYWSIMFLVLSVLCIILPIIGTGYTNDGTSIINPSADNGLSQGLYRLSQDDQFKNLYVNEDGILCDSSIENTENQEFYNNTSDTSFFHSTNLETANVPDKGITSGQASATTPLNEKYSYKINVSNGDAAVNVILLNVFSTSIDPNTSSNNSDAFNSLVNEQIFRAEGENGLIAECRPVNRSFIVFYPSGFTIFSFPPLPSIYPGDGDNASTLPTAGSNTSYTSFTGTFDHLKDFHFSELVCTEDYGPIDTGSEFFTKWNPFIEKSFLTIRDRSTWINVGIYGGCTIGAILLCGLVVWLFTLGRRNLLYKNCSLWSGLKIGMTESFTVAIIAMIFYFLNPTYCLVIGAMGLIMRTMWLIMKTTGGARGQDSKPLYQARQ